MRNKQDIINVLQDGDTGCVPSGSGNPEMFGAGKRNDDFPCPKKKKKMEAVKKKKIELNSV